MKQHFEPTVEGCKAAREFLIEHGSDWIRDEGYRTDGYTIVHMANKLKTKLESDQ